MSRQHDPMRIADLPEGEGDLSMLSSGIRTLRKAHGSDAQMQALAARLGPELAANAVAGTAVLSSALLRFMWIGAGVVGVSLGSWLMWADHDGRPVAARSAQIAEQPPAQRVAAALAPTEQPPLPSVQPADVQPAAEPAPRKHAQRPAAPRPQPAPRSQVDKRASAANPEAELVLLGRAQELLDRDPTGALDVLGQHARDHARGVFSEEREVLALEAESKLGHKALARARAERFIERFPRSAHARRVRTLLEPAP
jgi:hypothetical protein